MDNSLIELILGKFPMWDSNWSDATVVRWRDTIVTMVREIEVIRNWNDQKKDDIQF